ncbi:MAG: NAD(P)/FAD-dependent oxidoreductase [Thermoleophilia bacterium]|nr:NAD(P)/FAD-dependent oxidoreductase [Thermoleophilia bacterium]
MTEPRAGRYPRIPATRDRPHVAVIGSGFGGLFATKALRRDDLDVTLIGRTTHHLFQPLLYQVATGILSQGEIAPSTREVLSRQGNATVLLGEVTAVDMHARTVTSTLRGHTERTEYDYLIVAAGAGQSYFGNDHFATFAPGMKSIDDALELRGRIFGAFEMAEVVADEAERERQLTFVVVGAGPTGVEMAGQIAELSRRTLRRDFRRVNPGDARVILVDAVDRVLPQFGHRLSGAAREHLETMGVDVRLNSRVVDIDEHGVELETADGARTRIPCACKIWAAGVSGNPLGATLARQSGAELDRAGRVKVLPDLSLPGHPEVFVVGDLASLNNLPGVAQVAIQEAKHAARLIRDDAASATGTPSEQRPPFVYRDRGSMATISRFSAVASRGRIRLSGFSAWLAWLVVHLFYIIGFKRQLTTLVRWAVSFLGRGRAERTITRQQIAGRLALEQLGQDFPPPPGVPGGGAREADPPTEG